MAKNLLSDSMESLQFPPNTLVLAKRLSKNNLEGDWFDAKVLETRQSNGSTAFYVHYLEFDRRFDEWVLADRIRSWEQLARREESKQPLIEHDDHEGLDKKALEQHHELTKIKRIDYIAIGRHKCQTWYFSPFPEYFQNLETLYICEFCLSFFRSQSEIASHSRRCTILHPRGNEIYRDREVSIFEVDGARSMIYCENLCFVSKLFLDHKNLSFDVEMFMFYVLTESCLLYTSPSPRDS